MGHDDRRHLDYAPPQCWPLVTRPMWAVVALVALMLVGGGIAGLASLRDFELPPDPERPATGQTP
jgi:hypothetical protein